MEIVMFTIIEDTDTSIPPEYRWLMGLPSEPPTPQPIDCHSCGVRSVPPDHTCAAYLRERLDQTDALLVFAIFTLTKGDAKEAAREFTNVSGIKLPDIDTYRDLLGAFRGLRDAAGEFGRKA